MAINAAIFFGYAHVPEGLDGIANRALGILDGILFMVYGYIYGSSDSSREKNDTINRLSQK